MGEPVREADGRAATVVAVRVVPGAASMWDLTVSNVHDFAVGDGAFVVHNCGDPEGQVKFGETELSGYVKDARQATGETDHNYAAARLDNGEIRIGRSSAGYHAEEFLIDDAEDDGRTIVGLYSERQPCATKCSDLLMDHNPNMNISWTWPWEGENPGLSKEIEQFMRGVIR